MARYYDPGPSCGMRLPPAVLKRVDDRALTASCKRLHGEALAAKARQMLDGAPLDRFNQNALERIRQVANDDGETDLAVAIGAFLDHQTY